MRFDLMTPYQIAAALLEACKMAVIDNAWGEAGNWAVALQEYAADLIAADDIQAGAVIDLVFELSTLEGYPFPGMDLDGSDPTEELR